MVCWQVLAFCFGLVFWRECLVVEGFGLLAKLSLVFMLGLVGWGCLMWDSICGVYFGGCSSAVGCGAFTLF